MADVNPSSPNSPPSGSSSTLTTIQTVVAIVVTLMSGAAAYQSSNVKEAVALQSQKQNKKLEEIKTQIAKSADGRESRKVNNDITLKIFEELKDVYKTPDQSSDLQLNRLQFVGALVLGIPDEAIRNTLIDAIRRAITNLEEDSTNAAVSSKAKAVRKRFDDAVFRAEESDVSTLVPKDPEASRDMVAKSDVNDPKWSNYDFDLFWCEKAANPDEAKQIANVAAMIKGLDPQASGRWRVRMLPAGTNVRSGYQVEGYRIHVSSDDEQKIADVLKGVLAKQRIPADGQQFEIKKVGFATSSYISLFFCPGARNGW